MRISSQCTSFQRFIPASRGSSENESSESDESDFDQVEATTEKEIEGDFKCVSCRFSPIIET